MSDQSVATTIATVGSEHLADVRHLRGLVRVEAVQY
jgi:hypothetical protein